MGKPGFQSCRSVTLGQTSSFGVPNNLHSRREEGAGNRSTSGGGGSGGGGGGQRTVRAVC